MGGSIQYSSVESLKETKDPAKSIGKRNIEANPRISGGFTNTDESFVIVRNRIFCFPEERSEVGTTQRSDVGTTQRSDVGTTQRSDVGVFLFGRIAIRPYLRKKDAVRASPDPTQKEKAGVRSAPLRAPVGGGKNPISTTRSSAS